MTARFNLARDPWLPVLGQGGARIVSVHDALVDARSVRELDGLSPPEQVAVLRLLLAVLVDIHRWETSQEWGGVWRRGNFERAALSDYLDERSDHFELFADDRPFYQVADLRPTSPGGVKPVSLVMPEVASGNNTPLFSSLIDDRVPPLTPPQAAVRLITLLGYDTASIKTGADGDPAVNAGKTTGNPTGPLGSLGCVMATGRNLFETLMLNYPLGRVGSGDHPAWDEIHTSSWERRPARGVLDLLTWQSRRVRLLVNDEGLVDRVVVSAGDRLEHTPLFEPHTLWRQVKDGPVSHRPARHQQGRAPWRGLTSLLSLDATGGATTSGCLAQIGELEFDGHLDPRYPLDVITVGVVYGNMSAVVEDIISERMPLPIVALMADEGSGLRADLQGVAEAGDALMNALNRLQGDLRRAGGGDPLPWDGGQRPGEVFASAMGSPVRRLLRALQRGDDIEDALTVWELEARRIAREIAGPLVENAPPETFLGVGDGTSRINQALASQYFHGALRKNLMRAAEHDNQLKGTP